MVKRRIETSSLAAIDGVIALGIVLLCLLPHRDLLKMHPLDKGVISIADGAFAIAFLILWRYCFNLFNLYNKIATMPSRMVATFKAVAVMMVPIMLFMGMFHRSLATRHGFIVTFLMLFAYEVDRLFITGYLLDQLAARDPRRVIIIGSGRRAGKAWREIRTRYHSSIQMIGFVDDRELDEMPPEIANRFIGRVDDLSNLLLRQVVDVILIAMPIRSCYNTMQRAVETAEQVGVRVIYLGDIYSSKRRLGNSSEILFTELAPEQDDHLTRVLTKRILDIVVSAAALVVLSPLLLVIALAIKLTSRGPVFFCQQRFGQRRRLFTMYKFRSMVADAEARLPSLEHLNEAVGPIFKMENDPRITKIGRILRRSSMDELPQLWNVLKGDMSLVGPRPMSMRDVSLFSDATLLRRFSVKSGMTGLWQISRRGQMGFDDWVAFDTQYIDHWSLLLDCRILIRTIGAVVRGSGAF